MPSDDYRKALDAALREYETAIHNRAALDDRIAQLQQTIGTLTTLCGLTPTVHFGLTDACRLVLRNAPAPMTAVQVRDRLTAIGFDFDRYANGMAAIHTVLKRLEESGEAALADSEETTRQAYAFVQSGLIAARVEPRPSPPSATSPASARGRRPRASTRRGTSR